jgi:antitoxin (DNA-binding transcriptional repressor) of toxin-antitoxin stability system
MVITVEANTPDLLALVEHTRQGDEVLITVDGKLAGRVTAVAERPRVGRAEMEAMARELEAHLYDGLTGIPGTPIEQIIDELRGEPL